MGSTARAALGPSRPSPEAHERRRPETTVLHRVVSTHWPAFLEHVEAQGRALPAFVLREAGALLHDPAFARQLVTQLQSLVDGGYIARYGA